MRKNRFSTRLSSGVLMVAIAASGAALITHGVSEAASPAATPTQSPVAPTPPTIQLEVSPTSPITYKTPVKLTATISPATAVGKWQFKDGATPLDGPIMVSNGTAWMIAPELKGGTHWLIAEFTPTDSTDSYHSPSIHLEVKERPTMLKFSDASVAVLSPGKVTFAAKLTDDTGPLRGYLISFEGGDVACDAFTNQIGEAKCSAGPATESQLGGLTNGYVARFAGDDNYKPSSQHSATKLSVASPK